MAEGRVFGQERGASIRVRPISVDAGQSWMRARDSSGETRWASRYRWSSTTIAEVNDSRPICSKARAIATFFVISYPDISKLPALTCPVTRHMRIGLPHLEAALAVWDYCYASATLLFGRSTGDPVADRIREAIDASGGAMTKSQIVRLFHGHMETGRIDAALETLIALGALGIESERTGGRPSTRWTAIAADEFEEDWDSLAEDEEPVEAQ